MLQNRGTLPALSLPLAVLSAQSGEVPINQDNSTVFGITSVTVPALMCVHLIMPVSLPSDTKFIGVVVPPYADDTTLAVYGYVISPKCAGIDMDAYAHGVCV